jgi:hypothetical protein
MYKTRFLIFYFVVVAYFDMLVDFDSVPSAEEANVDTASHCRNAEQY